MKHRTRIFRPAQYTGWMATCYDCQWAEYTRQQPSTLRLALRHTTGQQSYTVRVLYI